LTVETKPLRVLSQDKRACDTEMGARTGWNGTVGKDSGSALTSTLGNVWRGEQEKGKAQDW